MNSRLCRCLRARGRWRPCVFVFVYYLITVFFVENILIATVHKQTSLTDDYDVVSLNVSRILLDVEEEVSSTATTTSTTTAKPSTSATTTLRTTLPHPALTKKVNLSTKEQEERFYSRRPWPVNRYLHRILLEPTWLCSPNTRIVILIHSYHTYTDRRLAIRSTWGKAVWTGSWPNEKQNRSCAGLRMAFVLGLHRDPGLNDLISEEHARYNDIVQGDFYDSYQNMTLKSLLDLKIVDERCAGVRYLLKTDDDMVVNLPYLLHLLDNVHVNLSRSIMGPLNVGSRVYRHGKWKLSKSEFPFDHYPPYESGSAYIITGDLIHELFVTAEYVPRIFIDDVYVTGILGRILGVTHVRQRGFAFWTDRPPSVCDVVQNHVVTGTKMTPQNLRSLWDQLNLNPKCWPLPVHAVP